MGKYSDRYSAVYKIPNSNYRLTYNQSGKSDFAWSLHKNTRKAVSELFKFVGKKNKVYFYYYTCLCVFFLFFCLASPLGYYAIMQYNKNLEFLTKLVIIWGQNVGLFLLNMFTWVKTRLYNLFETQSLLYIVPSKELNCFMPAKFCMPSFLVFTT